MRELRKRINGVVVFDYRELLDGRKQKGKVILKMKKGPMSYESQDGVRFFKEHPFQLVKPEEAEHLLTFKENNFVYFVTATPEDVEDYYIAG